MVGLFSYDRGGLLGGADGFLVSLDISVPIMGECHGAVSVECYAFCMRVTLL